MKTKKGENSTQSEPKIINLAIHLEKLTAQLSDGRELIIPIDWFAKWGVDNVSAEKLKRHEIWQEDEIYFPEIDGSGGNWKFYQRFCCWLWIIHANLKDKIFIFYSS